MEPRVAVTGASGFLGRHLATALRSTGHRVRAVVRRPDRAADLARAGDEVVRADVLDLDALTRALRGCEAVVANAAMGSWQGDLDAMQRVNVDGVRHTLQAAATAGVRRVVLISTVAVHRSRPWRPIAEDDVPTDPGRRRRALRDLTTDWRYALTKTRGERLAWELADRLDLCLTAVRPGPVYGPGDPKATARLLGWLDRRLVVLPTAGIPFVHVGDVADAVVRAVQRPDTAGRAYLLAGPPVSPVRIARSLRRHAGRGPWILPVPAPVWVAFDCRAAARDLDFAPRPLDEGLAQVIRAQGRPDPTEPSGR